MDLSFYTDYRKVVDTWLNLNSTSRVALISFAFASVTILLSRLLSHADSDSNGPKKSSSRVLGGTRPQGGRMEIRMYNISLDWKPDTTFRYPQITAHPTTSLSGIDVIPYRPFKWGPDYQ